MPIHDYVGCEGFCVDVQCSSDAVEALDRLHTQVMDILGNDHPMLAILEIALTAAWHVLDREEQDE